MKTLNDLFDEVRDMDIKDKEAMYKILEYMEELQEESDNYVQILLEKLKNVEVTWKRPWYQSSWSLKTASENVEKDDTTFLTGPLSKDECDRVEKNWRKFVKKYDVPDKLHCFARWKQPKLGCPAKIPEWHARRFVASYLARRLQRTVRQIYKHVVNYYSRPRKGQYTKDEQKIMDICFYHNPKKAPTILTTVLAREPRGLYNKLYSTIHGKKESKRIKWNLNLATKFLKLLMSCTGKKLKGLKNKQFGISVWRQLEDEFDTQAEYLRQFWYIKLHCQLFCKCDVTLRRVRRRVFKILRRSPYKVWTDIKWKDVVDELPDGFTYQFVYWVTVRIFRNDKLHTTASMDELVKIGLEKSKNKLYGNKRLRTLCLNKEGNLEVIRYDAKF